MKGRLESEILMNARLEEKMKDMPQYVEEFSYTIRDNEYRTVNEYINHIWRYLQWLASTGIDIANPENLGVKQEYYIGRYFTYLKTGGESRNKAVSASYRSVSWTALNLFFDYLVREKYVENNFVRNFKRANPEKDYVQKDSLDEDDIKVIIANIRNGVGNNGNAKYNHDLLKHRDLLLFLLMMDTGARISGVLELNIEDFSKKENKVTLTSKGNLTKEYKLSKCTMECLELWLKDRAQIINDEQNRAVFISKRGDRLSYRTVNTMFKKYSYNIDKRITPHTTRTTVATILYDKTKDVELVKDKLGHRSTKTTSRYIKKDEERMNMANQIGEDILKNALQIV